MGLDSVEIVLEVEESFGIEIPNEEAVSMRTPRQMVQYII
jgi:acyl carrier protein